MAAVSGIASTNGYSTVQGVGRPASARGQGLPDNATFEQDLLLSGLNAGVSTDELLKSVQTSIKSALNDPKNNSKDFFEVIQAAVQKTLQENGVDTEKLTSLLQSQIPDQDGLSAYGDASRGNRAFEAISVGPKGPPPAGGARHGSSSDANAKSEPSFLAVLDDLDFEDSSVQATPKSTKTTPVESATGAASSSTAENAADSIATQFKQLISDLIKSLPSGSTLDVRA